MTKIVDQMAEALSAFEACSTEPALIGGLALAVHNYVRATQDIDFLADATDADRLMRPCSTWVIAACIAALTRPTTFAATKASIFCTRIGRPRENCSRTRRKRDTALGRLRVVSAEGLIGFKLQAFVNNPKRTRDIDDIRQLLRNNHGALNMDQVRGYFALFQREAFSMNSSPKTR